MINSYLRAQRLWPLARHLASILTGLALLLAPVAHAQQGRPGKPTRQTTSGTAPANRASRVNSNPLQGATPIITSTAGASGSTTSTAPIPFNVNFDSFGTPTSVNDFTASDVTVTNGTVASFSGSGSSYTLTIAPSTNSSLVSVFIPYGAADRGASEASNTYSLQYTAPITVQSLQFGGASPTNAASVS
jgi:hypothetical protein